MSKAAQKILQRILLVLGVLALLVLIIELALSIGATQHGNTPARVVHVKAAPYALTVNLYTYPANAGFALPFSVQAQPARQITYSVVSVPLGDLRATPVRASFSSNGPGSIQGDAEITVRGPWVLVITVFDRSGSYSASVPIEATAPPAMPDWLGWLIGSIPIAILLLFLVLQGRGGKDVNLYPAHDRVFQTNRSKTGR